MPRKITTAVSIDVEQASKPVEINTPHLWRDLLQPVRLLSVDADGVETVGDETERILFSLAQAMEQRDNHTAGHCERLAFMSAAMGVYMGFDRPSLLALYRGGYLHDVGKVGIPDNILFKPDRLNQEEWSVMCTHPLRGVEICRHMKTLASAVPIIRHHHERWDGTGYPDGLRGEEIPLMARVVQVADIYDALTSPRVYKRAYSPEKALAIIQEETDRGWRDAKLVKIFLALHKDVISKAEEYTNRDHSLEAMRAALYRLHRL